MPKCFQKNCNGGIVTVWENGVEVKKMCKKCEKMEKDLLESEDYDVYIVNGRVAGYELIDKTN